MRHPHLIAAPLLLAAAVATPFAAAAESPARKSGLWEITNVIGGPQPMTQTLQQCIDEKSDRLTEQAGGKEAQQHCAKNEVVRAGSKVIADSQCRFAGTTATTHAEFTGDFSSHYRGDIRTTYSPPMQGIKDMQVSISAKWLGPCQAGQKPGDVVLPGGMKFNAQELQKRAR